MGKCGVSAFSLADRFRLCDALYALCRETALVPVSGREDLCEGLLSSLLEDRALTGQPVAGDEDTVCACCRALQSALFPWVEEDDSWFRSLCAGVRNRQPMAPGPVFLRYRPGTGCRC